MYIPNIGMRNIKTTVSVFLCLAIFEIVNRDNSFYACIAAVICMQPTLENTYSKGITRINGTIIGGLLGAVFLIVGEYFNSDKAIIILIPLGITLIIELCVYLKQRDAVVISSIVFIGLMILQGPTGNYFWHTVNRIIDTSVGIIIAVLINRYFKLPARLNKYIKGDLK